ncbi:helix-turn-helix transcriptional regulator [Nitrosospira sp. NpAV]|uniref:helix-turn-helix transcriptional regulator n=1 Tax=Nitrosospira sp. NpAV TaxID=58133 RepID=UPI0005A14565|nr:helix-turn-helix transcriptional regulator [Nitrosospira sp. NpAV]KIO50266.1 hypothetical protein SQ11_00745 [Nitrosospira sp. NpAV]
MSSIVQTELNDLSGLVDRVYQAALNPSAWSDTLPAMAEWLEAPMAMLFTPTMLPQDGGFYFNYGIPEAAMELWRTRYQPLDIWTTAAIQSNRFQEGLIFTGEDIVSTEELAKSTWYQEFLSKIGIGQVLVNTVYGFDSQVHRPTVISYFRNLNDTGFSVQDRWKSSLLLPHVSRAMGVASRLRNAEYQLANTLTALDRLNHGILLMGENEEVVFSNQAALRILSLEDGLRLQVQNHQHCRTHLVAKLTRNQELMDEAIREAVKPSILSAQHFSKTVVISRPSGKPVFTLNFSSLPVQHGFAVGVHSNPKAIAFITDGAAPVEINHTLLTNAYGLTKAEISVAELIMDGKSLEESSVKCGLSINTLKTHLNRIYGKTNTANRAMLVKLLVTLSQNA